MHVAIMFEGRAEVSCDAGTPGVVIGCVWEECIWRFGIVCVGIVECLKICGVI